MRNWWNSLRIATQPRPGRRRPLFDTLEDRLAPAGLPDLGPPAAAITGSFSGLIRLPQANSDFPYRGQGYTVALLDTGIDYNHSDLGGGFGAGHRVIGGYDFVNNDADPMDDNGHGTVNAGIIGGSGSAFPGVAPQVNFVAVKVLDANATGDWTNIDKGLQWVIANQAKYNIVAVNLSFGSGNYGTSPYTFLDNDFASLKGMGVFTAVAAGNNYYYYGSQPGVAFPAVVSNVVSVGAVWDGDFGQQTFATGATDYTTAPDRIGAFGQRSSALSIMAPGAWITSTAKGGGYTTMGGTSMATAVVTGSAVLLHQAIDTYGPPVVANQDTILGLMRSSGITVKDGDDEDDNVTNTGLSFKRLDLDAALKAVARPPVVSTIPNQTMKSGGSVTVAFTASDPNGTSVSLTPRIVDDKALAYQLDTQYQLSQLSNYNLNRVGLNEKWLSGPGGKTTFFILPNGEFRRYTGSVVDSLRAGNLLGVFSTSYYADPSKLWNAPVASYVPFNLSIIGKTLTIQATQPWSGSFLAEVTATDGTFIVRRQFTVTVAATANTPPVFAAIPDRTVSHAQDHFSVTLAASDADGDPLTFSATVLPANGQTPPVTVGVSGSVLNVSGDSGFVGTYTVSVSVSDGKASVSQTFNVTATNAGPQFAAVADQSLGVGKTSLVVPLSATDADGDPLTFSATVETPDSTAYFLDQQLGLSMYGNSYYTNTHGANEKLLIDRKYVWYVLLPDGRLYRWFNTFAQTVTAVNLVATFNASFYNEPRLLWDPAPPVEPAIQATFTGNQLVLTRPPDVHGVYFIDVTATDGFASAKRRFQLTLNS